MGSYNQMPYVLHNTYPMRYTADLNFLLPRNRFICGR